MKRHWIRVLALRPFTFHVRLVLQTHYVLVLARIASLASFNLLHVLLTLYNCGSELNITELLLYFSKEFV